MLSNVRNKKYIPIHQRRAMSNFLAFISREENDKTNILKLNSSKLLEKTNYKHIVEYNKRDSKSTSIKILLSI